MKGFQFGLLGSASMEDSFQGLNLIEDDRTIFMWKKNIKGVQILNFFSLVDSQLIVSSAQASND